MESRGIPAAGAPASAEALLDFCDRVTRLLNLIALYLPDPDDRLRLSRAADELRSWQEEELPERLGALEEDGSLERAGLTGSQLDFKIGSVAVAQGIEEAGHPPRGLFAGLRKRRRADRLVRILGRAKVVIGSLKSISKWFEALAELVEMAEKALSK